MSAFVPLSSSFFAFLGFRMETDKNSLVYAIHRELMQLSKRAMTFVGKSTEHLEVIRLFKGSVSYELNAYLRKDAGFKFHLDAEMLQFIAAAMSQLISMSRMKTTPVIRPVRLFRIVFGAFAAKLKKAKPNSNLQTRGFSSWTFDDRYASQFVKYDDNDIVILTTELQPALPFLYIDAFRCSVSKPGQPSSRLGKCRPWPYQAEVVLDTGLCYKIISKRSAFVWNEPRNVNAFPYDNKRRMQVISVRLSACT